MLDDIYKKEFSIKLNDLFSQKRWEDAINLLQIEISKYPKEYFLHTSLSKAFFNQRNYEAAYNAALKAKSLEADDPLVIYDYACTLYSLRKFREAIDEFKRIAKQNPVSILDNGFGENLKWVKSIINDSKYRMAMCYIELGENSNAIELINQHFSNRQRGLYSDFTKNQIIRVRNSLINK